VLVVLPEEMWFTQGLHDLFSVVLAIVLFVLGILELMKRIEKYQRVRQGDKREAKEGIRSQLLYLLIVPGSILAGGIVAFAIMTVILVIALFYEAISIAVSKD
jgi:hypothetical protein